MEIGQSALRNKRNYIQYIFVLFLPLSWASTTFGSFYRLLAIALLVIYLILCKGILSFNHNNKEATNAWMVYCIYAICSFIWSGMGVLSQNTVLGMLILFGISVTFYTSKVEMRWISVIDYCWIIGGIVLSLLFLTGKSVNIGYGTRQTLLILGTQTDPNEFASYFVVALPLSVHHLLSDKNRIMKLIHAFITIGGVYIILRSGSRGALLALMIALIVTVSLEIQISMKKILLTLFIVFVGYYILTNYIIPLIPERTLQRLSIEALVADNGSGRSSIWESGLKQFFEGNILTWLFGYGYGGLIINTNLSYMPQTTTMHNQLLQQLTCYGIIGLVLYIRLVLIALKEFIKNKKQFIGPFIGILAMGMTITMGPSYKILWILIFYSGVSLIGSKNNNGGQNEDYSNS